MSDDCISRQAAIDAVIKRDANCGIDSVEVLKTLPSVTQKPKPGHWITEDMFDGGVAYRCSECGELFWIVSGTPKTNEYNFCPKCGIRLIESQERSENKE